jgi:WD40 repeat protein
MVTSSEDCTVKIWDTRTGAIQRSYSHGAPVNDVIIHPNQGELISCDRAGSIRLWDLAENNCSHQLIPEEDVSVSCVTVSSEGTMLCAANNAVSPVRVHRLDLLVAVLTTYRVTSSFGVLSPFTIVRNSSRLHTSLRIKSQSCGPSFHPTDTS